MDRNTVNIINLGSTVVRNILNFNIDPEINSEEELSDFLEYNELSDEHGILIDKSQKLSDMLILSCVKLQDVCRPSLSYLIRIFLDYQINKKSEINSSSLVNYGSKVFMFYNYREISGRYSIKLYYLNNIENQELVNRIIKAAE